MKLKNIIKIGSFVVAGTLPTISKAQYVCQTCPAGTYSSGGLSTTCTPCPSGQTSSAGASSCYTPLSCSGNNIQNASKTQCLSLLDKNRWIQYGSVKGGNCQDITLYPNIQYLVYLRGGDGGGAYVAYCDEEDDDDCVVNSYGFGAYVEYKFTVSSQTSAKICAGKSAVKGRFAEYAIAGGDGSWIQIGDKYIVAGGGYGLSISNGTRYQSYGGGGGAIGYGGKGAIWSKENGCGGGNNCCSAAGEGLDGIGGGRGGSKHLESKNRNCGSGLGGEVNPSRLFTGLARSGRLGGSASGLVEEDKKAKSSHDSNFSLNLGCQTLKEGCATIYKFNNN